MNFNDLHLNHGFAFMKNLVLDRRFRHSLLYLILSIIVLTTTYLLYTYKQEHLKASLHVVSSQTSELLHRLEVKRQQQQVPKFEASMHAVGAYHQQLSPTQCASQVAYCFLQKIKPQISITSKTLAMDPVYSLGSFAVEFKSSYDYEIFDMMEYIFSNSNTFGLSRLREFEIEQLFETSPIVKGRFIYDQLSLKP